MTEAPYADLDLITDVDEFVAALSALVAGSGMSIRDLARAAGAAHRPPQRLPHTTISNLLSPGRRRLSLDLVTAVLRALGLDDATVAQWQRTLVRVHVAAKTGGPVGVLRQLPPDLVTFTGRDAMVRAVLDVTAAATGSETGATVAISALEGMAGVGKTQLAVHVAHEAVRAGRHTDAQLFVNLHGFDAEYPPADPSEVLAMFLRALGVSAAHVPDDVDERAAMFRDRLYGKSAVIVLDNAADENQVRHLIPGAPGCLVLITSRRSLAALDGATQHYVDVFSVDEALDLLRRVVGAQRVDAEREAAHEIVEVCGRLPLALSLAAARLRSRPAWALADLAERLHGRGLDAVRVGGRGVRAVFELSFRSLPEEAQHVFRMLGLFPGLSFTGPAVAALVGLDVAEAEDILEVLLDENLLLQQRSDRYEFHDLMRVWVRELAAELSADERGAAIERLASWYLSTAAGAAVAIGGAILPSLPDGWSAPGLDFGAHDEAMAWFDVEHGNLAAVQGLAAEQRLHELVWRLAVFPKVFYATRRLFQDCLVVLHRALTSVEELGDPDVIMLVRSGLGATYLRSGRLDEAEPHYREQLAIAEKEGNVLWEGMATSDLGGAALLRRNYREGADMLRRAVKLLETVGDAERLASALMNLGQAMVNIDGPQTGLAISLQALPLARQGVNRRMETLLIGNIAELYTVLGDHESALESYEAHDRLGLEADDAHVRAPILVQHGDLLERLGRHTEAHERWTEAVTQYEKSGATAPADLLERLRPHEPGSVAREVEQPDVAAWYEEGRHMT